MISLDIGDEQFRSILRRELNLSGKATFQTRKTLEGTQLYEYCLFTIADGDLMYILIRGTFVVTEVYILIRTDFPEDVQFYRIAEELREKGLDPAKTRLVCIAVNISEDAKTAGRFPDIQIVRIPF